MKEFDFEDTLTEAEKACAAIVARTFAGKTYRALNPGDPECQVFDIGQMMNTGSTTTFDAAAYHFRAKLEIFRRDRTALQRDIMKCVRTLPFDQDAEAIEDTNLLCFRIAPEAVPVSEITVTDVSPDKDVKSIGCFTATILFDVVFQARFD